MMKQGDTWELVVPPSLACALTVAPALRPSLMTAEGDGAARKPSDNPFVYPAPGRYGDQARGEHIKAGSTLIFELELAQVGP